MVIIQNIHTFVGVIFPKNNIIPNRNYNTIGNVIVLAVKYIMFTIYIFFMKLSNIKYKTIDSLSY